MQYADHQRPVDLGDKEVRTIEAPQGGPNVKGSLLDDSAKEIYVLRAREETGMRPGRHPSQRNRKGVRHSGPTVVPNARENVVNSCAPSPEHPTHLQASGIDDRLECCCAFAIASSFSICLVLFDRRGVASELPFCCVAALSRAYPFPVVILKPPPEQISFVLVGDRTEDSIRFVKDPSLSSGFRTESTSQEVDERMSQTDAATGENPDRRRTAVAVEREIRTICDSRMGRVEKAQDLGCGIEVQRNPRFDQVTLTDMRGSGSDAVVYRLARQFAGVCNQVEFVGLRLQGFWFRRDRHAATIDRLPVVLSTRLASASSCGPGI